MKIVRYRHELVNGEMGEWVNEATKLTHLHIDSFTEVQ
jgi:hypothetical protein